MFNCYAIPPFAIFSYWGGQTKIELIATRGNLFIYIGLWAGSGSKLGQRKIFQVGFHGSGTSQFVRAWIPGLVIIKKSKGFFNCQDIGGNSLGLGLGLTRGNTPKRQ